MSTFFPHSLSCSFLLFEQNASLTVSRRPPFLPSSLPLTFNLGVQVVDYDLELPQRHVPQVGGFQASLHETLADVRHVRQLLAEREKIYTEC